MNDDMSVFKKPFTENKTVEDALDELILHFKYKNGSKVCVEFIAEITRKIKMSFFLELFTIKQIE